GAVDSNGTGQGSLFAFSSTGTLKWVFPTGDFDVRSQPTIDADGTIYFGTKGTPCYVYAVHPDGTEKWHYKTADDAGNGGTDVYNSPTLGNNGLIYVFSEWGWLYAFNPDGSVNWKDINTIPSGGTTWSSGALAADGTIYYGNGYGYMAAIQTTSLGLSS